MACVARHIVTGTAYNPHYAEMAETIGTNSGMLGVETLTKPVGLMELRAALIPPEDYTSGRLNDTAIA